MTDDTRDDPEAEPLAEVIDGSTEDEPTEAPADAGSGDTESERHADPDPERRRGGETTDRRRSERSGHPLEGRSAGEVVELVALAGLVVLGAIAAIGFYNSAATAINRLVSPEFQPMFQAAFDLVVLLAAGIGVSVLLRRRSGASQGLF